MSKKPFQTPPVLKRSLPEAAATAFKSAWSEFKPNPDGSCKNEGCDGVLEAHAVGTFGHEILYSDPTCNRCRRVYADDPNAAGIRRLGAQELRESMTTFLIK